jgi:ureidoglycolate hydrolase
MKLGLKQATAESMAPFGGVVQSPAGRPTTSEASDYKFWSDIAHFRVDGETEIGICTVYAMPGEPIASMERHLRTPEILIPIDAPFAVPLMLDGESSATVFRVNLGEALMINPAVWHGACLPVGKKESSYFVIFRRGTPHEDVEKKKVTPFEVEPA